MVTIRLAKEGARNKPSYRVIVVERDRKRGGKPIEVLGFWYPLKKEKKIDKKRWDYWVNLGAKPSRAAKLLD